MAFPQTPAPRPPHIDDPSNTRLIDPIARLLVPAAVRLRISANFISVAGLPIGLAAAFAYARWQRPGMAIVGFLITILWVTFDSLDGMVARATGTSSDFGRALDGICDHIVFAFLYIGMALSIGGVAIWALMLIASAAHAVQASLYEAERHRFNRRMRDEPPPCARRPSRNPLIRLYDWIASWLDGASAPFERLLAVDPGVKPVYARTGLPIFTAMLPLTQNFRLVALFLAYLARRTPAFLWYELVALSLWTAIGIARLRKAEKRLLPAT